MPYRQPKRRSHGPRERYSRVSCDSEGYNFLEMCELPQLVKDAVLASSEPVAVDSLEIRGYDFSDGVDYHALLDSYKSTGFQATHFGKAVEEINKMVRTLYITISQSNIIILFLKTQSRRDFVSGMKAWINDHALKIVYSADNAHKKTSVNGGLPLTRRECSSEIKNYTH